MLLLLLLSDKKPMRLRGLSLAAARPDLASQWHPTLNEYGADEVSPGSHYSATWHNCPADPRHIWTGQVNSRSKPIRPYGCAVCSGKQVMIGVSDLATTHPEIAAQWNSELNDKTPQEVGQGSSYKAYWSGCPIDPGHTWKTAVGNRTLHKTGCSVCAGQVVQPGYNDLATQHPQLALQWHPIKNDRPPAAFTGTSGVRVHWLCDKGHDWIAAIASRSTGPKSGCPTCSLGSTSKPEILVRSLLSGSGVIRVTSTDPVKVQVPWLGRKRISVDVLGDAGGLPVALEYDGAYYHGENRPKALLHDTAKTAALLGAGYFVIRLREGKLPHLDIVNPRLFQLSFPYTLDQERAASQLEPVLTWVRQAVSRERHTTSAA